METARIAVAAFSVAVVMSLTACVPSPTPPPSPTPAPTHSATPTAAPTPSASATPRPSTQPASAAKLVLSGDGFFLVDDQDDALDQSSWTASTTRVSAALEGAFGIAPEIADRVWDGFHLPVTFTSYVWPGLELWDLTSEGDGGQMMLLISAPEINGVRIESASGIHVGLSVVDALESEPYHQTDYPGHSPSFFFDPATNQDTELHATSGVRADSDGQVITLLVAPASDAL